MTAPIKPHFSFLDVFRGIAAFLVVLEHARNYLWVDYEHLQNPDLLLKCFYFVSRLGNVSVMGFFVLSGCLIGMIVLRDTERDRWSWSHYLSNRLTRLWVVLLPALLLTLIFDFSTLRFADQSSFVFHGEFAHIQHLPLGEKLGWEVFLGNAFFLQTILVPPLGSNGPLWSLAYEFWYYIIFPLLAVPFLRRSPWPARGLPILAGLVLLASVSRDIAQHFAVWFMGVGAAVLHGRLKFGQPAARCGFLVFLGTSAATAALHRSGHLADCLSSGYAANCLLGMNFAALVYFSLHLDCSKHLDRISQFFSKFSYTLYLVHLPFLTCLVAPFISNNEERMRPSLMAWIWLIGLILAAYLYAYGVFLLTEKHTDAIRKFLGRISPTKSRRP